MAHGGEGRSRWTGRRWRPAAVAAVWAAAGTAAAVVGAAAPAGAGTNVWTPIGPNGGFVSALVVDPADPQVLYAGTHGGVFKSADGGASWRAASRGLKIFPITALAVDPRQRGTVYAAAGDATTFEVGVWGSRDGGATWSSGLSFSNGYARDGGEEFFSGLAVDPVRPGTVVAASNFALYVSHDRGQGWSTSKEFFTINPEQGVAIQVAADPSRGSIFAYVAGQAIGRDPGPYVKLFESADGGETWSDRTAGLPAVQAGLFAIEPTSPGLLYLVQDGKIFRSLDGAASWREARPGRGPIAAGPHGLVIAGDPAAGFVRSTDGGRNWEAIATPPVDIVSAFAFGAAPDQIYAVGDALGVLASDDGGQSWRAANRGLTATTPRAVAVDPAKSARIYTAVADVNFTLNRSGLWKTRNAGARWRPIGADLGATSFRVGFDHVGLFVDPANPSSLLYTNPQYAARSSDGGTSWTQLALPSCLSSQFITPEPTSPSVLYTTGSCAQHSCGASKSVDGGATWSCLVLENALRIVVAPSDPAVLYAITSVDSTGPHLLWRSGDAGASWAAIDAGLPPPLPSDGPPTLAVDPSNAQRLFLAFPKSVWRSLDGGSHWSERDRGLPLAKAADFPNTFPPLLAVDPGNPSLVYVGASYLGVYRSLDGGNRWQPILAGLPPLNAFFGASFYHALTPDPKQSGTVYLAVSGNGLLVYSAP